MLTVDALNSEHGVIVSDNGTITVLPDRVKAARQTAHDLRREAEDADREAAYARSKGVRKFMLQAARRCRYRAEKIEKQCDSLQPEKVTCPIETR